jgi:hypothetical protein
MLCCSSSCVVMPLEIAQCISDESVYFSVYSFSYYYEVQYTVTSHRASA